MVDVKNSIISLSLSELFACCMFETLSVVASDDFFILDAGQRSDSFDRCKTAGRRPFDQISEGIN